MVVVSFPVVPSLASGNVLTVFVIRTRWSNPFFKWHTLRLVPAVIVADEPVEPPNVCLVNDASRFRLVFGIVIFIVGVKIVKDSGAGDFHFL